jgi:hypothetical protein
MKKLIILLVAIGLTYGQNLRAQNTQADLKVNISSKVNSLQLTDAGTVILSTNDGLVGVYHENSEPVFEFTEYGKIKEDAYYMVPNSPYMMVADGGFAAMKQKKAVLNYFTGKVIFESKDQNWGQVFTETVAIPQNKLIISGFQKTGDMAENVTPKVAVYDLETGEEDFSFFLVEPGKVTMRAFMVTGDVVMLDNKILIPTSQGVIAKSFSGETIWENKVKNVTSLYVDDKTQSIYAVMAGATAAVTGPKGAGSRGSSGKAKITKMDFNGNESWEDYAKVKGRISNFQITDKGIAIVTDKEGGSSMISLKKAESEIAFLSAENGEDLWDKAPKTKGYVQHFYEVEDGFLFGIQEGGINKISFDGKGLFKKPLKTGENIITMALSPQGLIYITSEDANIVNLETGETVWNKPLKFKRSESVVSTYDETSGKYIIATEKTMFAVDENSGEYKELASYKFEEKETPTDIQMRDSNIYMSSNQNMYLFGNDGNKIYHQYYKSPGISTFGKIALGVLAVASTAMMANQSMVAGANRNTLGQYNRYGAQAQRNADLFEGIATASFTAMAKRFRASATTKDSHVLLTKTDNGVGLLKLAKDTGKTEKEITIGDKKPEYILDEIDNVMYYLSDNQTISIFKI